MVSRCVLASIGLVALSPVLLADPETGSPTNTTPPAAPAAPASAGAPEAAKPVHTEQRENGLLIEDLVIGTGTEIKPAAYALLHYRGTLKPDGKPFDSSYDRGMPITASLVPTKMIMGWVEGVPGMKVGGKRRLTVPAAMAYKDKGYRDKNGSVIIPPNTDLVFEIEAVAALVIEDVKVGEGKECTGPEQTVTVFYHGTLASDGTVFDSNVGKEASTWPLRRLVRGWQMGIPGMKVGGKRRLVVPWQWAYGEGGSPPVIPGKADLVFEIELVDVK